MKTALLWLGLLLLPLGIQAQNYTIDWYKIAGGGGVSTGGNYSLSGTIGQPDAGVMIGGNYSVVGGFWGIIATVPTAGAPSLMISLTTSNTVLIAWPSPSTGFVLQQNGDLTTSNWLTAPETVADDGTTRSVVVNPPVGSVYFRLKH
jgi:hypothetical protein